jgi:hypothetical protein
MPPAATDHVPAVARRHFADKKAGEDYPRRSAWIDAFIPCFTKELRTAMYSCVSA